MKFKSLLLSLLLPLGLVVGCGPKKPSPTPGGDIVDPTPGGDTQDPTPGGDTQDPTPGGDTQDPTPGGDEKPVEKNVLTKKHLEDLAKGFKLDSSLTSTQTQKGKDPVTVKQLVETQVLDTKITVKAYAEASEGEPTKEKLYMHETYEPKEKDGVQYVAQSRLGVDNKPNYYRVLNPSTSEYFLWDDGFGNPFTSIELAHFSKKSEGVYTLKLGETSLESAYKEFSVATYGNPGLTLTGVELRLKDEKVDTLVTTYGEESKLRSYEYTIESKVVASGVTEIDSRTVPYEDVEDARFEEAITKLKAKNFTMQQVSQILVPASGNQEAKLKLVSQSVFNYTPNSYYGQMVNIDETTDEVSAMSDGARKLADGTVQGLVVTDLEKASFTDGGLVDSTMFDYHYVPFDISRATWDPIEDEDTSLSHYGLKADIDSDLYDYTPFVGLTEVAPRIEMVIATQGGSVSTVTFALLDEDNNTIVTYTNFGNVPEIKDEQVAPKVAGTWETMAGDAQTLTLLQSMFGDPVALPVPEALDQPTSWVNIGENGLLQLLYVGQAPVTAKDIEDWTTALLADGWVADAEITQADPLGAGSDYYSKTIGAEKIYICGLILPLGDIPTMCIAGFPQSMLG